MLAKHRACLHALFAFAETLEVMESSPFTPIAFPPPSAGVSAMPMSARVVRQFVSRETDRRVNLLKPAMGLYVRGSGVHRAQVLVKPGQGLPDELGSRWDVIGLEENEAFVLLLGPQGLQHGLGA